MLRDQAWKLQGIVNGIDYKDWSPTCDPFLQDEGQWGYLTYTLDTLKEGKAACKAALQRVRLARQMYSFASNAAVRGRLAVAVGLLWPAIGCPFCACLVHTTAHHPKP